MYSRDAKLFTLPRAADILNMILPSWPIMRSGLEQDPWDPETQEDARLTRPGLFHGRD